MHLLRNNLNHQVENNKETKICFLLFFFCAVSQPNTNLMGSLIPILGTDVHSLYSFLKSLKRY